MVPDIVIWLTAYVVTSVVGAGSFAVFSKQAWGDPLEAQRRILLGGAAGFAFYLGASSGFIPGLDPNSLGALFVDFFMAGWWAPSFLEGLANSLKPNPGSPGSGNGGSTNIPLGSKGHN
jgi:hypothetical protein